MIQAHFVGKEGRQITYLPFDDPPGFIADEFMIELEFYNEFDAFDPIYKYLHHLPKAIWVLEGSEFDRV